MTTLLFHIISFPYRYLKHVRTKRGFKLFGKKSNIDSPLYLFGKHNIEIGSNVSIHYKAWLQSLPLTGENSSVLKIGDGTTIGDFNHIVATKSIVIEEHVLTANHVYITDNLHEYSDISIPIKNQPIKQLQAVVIGAHSWIGENVSIIGASIGKHCVIGANSVVTHDIPDYCVAVGSPAYIIKRYNFETEQWERTDKDGNIIKI